MVSPEVQESGEHYPQLYFSYLNQVKERKTCLVFSENDPLAMNLAGEWPPLVLYCTYPQWRYLIWCLLRRAGFPKARSQMLQVRSSSSGYKGLLSVYLVEIDLRDYEALKML